MSKSQATAAVSKIVVDTKIGKLRFRQTPKGAFIVRCRGQERIRIRFDDDSNKWVADAKFFHVNGDETQTVTAATPEKAFKRAIRSFWS